MESHCAWIWRNAPWQFYQPLKEEFQREASLCRKRILQVAQACTMTAIYRLHLYSCSNDWRESSRSTQCHRRSRTQLVSIWCSCKSLNMCRISMIMPLGIAPENLTGTLEKWARQVSCKFNANQYRETYDIPCTYRHNKAELAAVFLQIILLALERQITRKVA